MAGAQRLLPLARRFRRGSGPGDGGQSVTAIVLMVFVAILAVFVWGVIPLGQASDESSRAGTAADAAALAAGGAVRDEILAILGSGVPLAGFAGLPFPCGAGSVAAADYAGRNGADVVGYTCPAGTARIEVTVAAKDPGVGDAGPARGRAAVSVRLPLDACVPPVIPPPPTTSTTTTTTMPGDPPPAPATTTTTTPGGVPAGTDLVVTCVSFDLAVVVRPDGRLALLHPEAVATLLVPRLVAIPG